MQRSYRLKLSCANCGMRGFYEAPAGSEFWPADLETGIPHSYEPSHLEHADEGRSPIDCRNCGIACLSLEYWDEAKLQAHTKQPKAAARG